MSSQSWDVTTEKASKGVGLLALAPTLLQPPLFSVSRHNLSSTAAAVRRTEKVERSDCVSLYGREHDPAQVTRKSLWASPAQVTRLVTARRTDDPSDSN